MQSLQKKLSNPYTCTSWGEEGVREGSCSPPVSEISKVFQAKCSLFWKYMQLLGENIPKVSRLAGYFL